MGTSDSALCTFKQYFYHILIVKLSLRTPLLVKKVILRKLILNDNTNKMIDFKSVVWQTGEIICTVPYPALYQHCILLMFLKGHLKMYHIKLNSLRKYQSNEAKCPD